MYRFVTPVFTTVVVHHRRVAFKDILRGVIEHMIMEPVRTHDFTLITPNVDPTVFAGLNPWVQVINEQRFALSTRI
jgi:hypothetical protein